MRKITLLTILLIATISAHAQNIQFHHDFGRDLYPKEEAGRPRHTMTVEQFKADKWGSWFYFIDIDFSSRFTEGAYTEVSREFNLGKQSPLAAHIEYNGGLGRGYTIQHATLIGPAWNGHSADFSKTYSVQLLYKQYFKGDEGTHAYSSVQLTGVWGITFAHKACTFSGYIDFSRGEKANRHGQLVILSEPQFWYNLNTLKGLEDVNLSVGSEVKISHNFIFNTDPTSHRDTFINPTLALKWTF